MNIRTKPNITRNASSLNSIILNKNNDMNNLHKNNASLTPIMAYLLDDY